MKGTPRIATSFSPATLRAPLGRLRRANAAFARRHPGDPTGRQPVHTVYGGAQIFQADSAGKLGALALRAVREYAPDAHAFAYALGMPQSLADRVYPRVLAKLEREPVEDYRIDFEDGYGNRPDAEEDGDAVRAAEEVARGMAGGCLPPFIGMRVKPLSGELFGRSLRTLDVFVTALAARTRGSLPPFFVVTIPKVTIPEHVSTVAGLCGVLERNARLPRGSLKLEIMVETPQSIFGPDGTVALRDLVAAGQGRVTGAHFGTYDYTASCNITAAHQGMTHPACDFAKHVMQVSLAASGVTLSDGATNIMPVAPHRVAPGGPPLSNAQVAENQAAVHRVWRLHFDQVTTLPRPRVLPGLGPPPRTASHPVRRRLRVLPRRARGGFAPAPILHGEGGPGHAARGRLRRRGHRTGTAELLHPRPELRRHHRRGGGRHRPHPRRDPGPVLPEDPRRATETIGR